MPYKDREKQKQAQRDHYKNNRKDYDARARTRRKERKEWFKELTKDIKCKNCSENDPACMDFHHRDPNTKSGLVSRLLNELRSKESVLKEMAKCDILCSNCHRKYHYYRNEEIE